LIKVLVMGADGKARYVSVAPLSGSDNAKADDIEGRKCSIVQVESGEDTRDELEAEGDVERG
jgi:hypothetical protein